MSFMDEDEDKEPPINQKKMVYIILGSLAVGFISVLFIMIPWLSYNDADNLRAVMIDNAIILVIAVLFVFGFYMATRVR